MPVRNAILHRFGGTFVFAAVLQASAVVIGYFCGVAIGYPGDAPSMYTVIAVIAGLLMLVGTFVASPRPVQEVKSNAAVCIASLLYSVGVIFGEPFYRVTSAHEIVAAAFVLVPLLFSINYLVHARAWVPVAGVTLFVFTCSAMIGSNANNRVHGSGFFSSWIA